VIELRRKPPFPPANRPVHFHQLILPVADVEDFLALSFHTEHNPNKKLRSVQGKFRKELSMSRLGTLLRGLRIGKQLDLQSMAYTLGVPPRRLQLIETGAAFPPAAERRTWARVLGFSDLVDFDRQWRDGWTRITLSHRDGHIPIINRAPAGSPIDYEEYGIDSGVGFEYVPRSPGMDDEILFAVIVIGDSMFPAYREGDLVIFRPLKQEESLPDGSPVFIRFSADRDHACTFKTIWRRPNGRLDLRPENPAHRTMTVATEEIDRMALAIERRPKFWIPPTQRRVRDEYVQEFPEE
jgi:SOS-response transcriptional repressor LexA